MKVLFPLKSLSNLSSTRGIGVYTRELTTALQKKYHSSKFIASPKSPKDLGVDLVHYPFFDPFFLTLKTWRTVPTIITIHDLIPLKFSEHFPAGIRGRLKWLLQRERAKRVEHIITDSECSKSDIVELLKVDPAKVSVVPLGPNRSHAVQVRMSKKIVTSYKLPERYLLYVGDVNWNKNVVGLVQAFAAINDPSLHLVLVGKVFADRPAIKEYQLVESAISQSGKSDRILTLGYVPSHHLSVIYSRATLYVQPSWYEGFGLPVLEAMKHACPVASSDRGSLPEIGGDAVAYFDPNSNMVEVITSLLRSDTKLASMKEAGLAQAAKFSWDKTASLTHAVYQKVISHTSVS